MFNTLTIEPKNVMYKCSLSLKIFESIYLPEDLFYLSNRIGTIMVDGEQKTGISSLPRHIKHELLDAIKAYIIPLNPFFLKKRLWASFIPVISVQKMSQILRSAASLVP